MSKKSPKHAKHARVNDIDSPLAPLDSSEGFYDFPETVSPLPVGEVAMDDGLDDDWFASNSAASIGGGAANDAWSNANSQSNFAQAGADETVPLPDADRTVALPRAAAVASTNSAAEPPANPLYAAETAAIPTINTSDYVYAGDDAVVGANEFAGFQNMKPDRGGNKKKAAIICGVIVGIIAVIYIVGLILFTVLFYPNTTVGSIDASMKTSDAVASELDRAISSYNLKVTGPNGFTYSTSTSDAGLALDSKKITESMHEALPGWQWPYLLVKSLTGKNDMSDVASSTYDETALGASIAAAVEQYNATATLPTNATIAYNATSKQFAVQPEQVGTALDTVQVVKEIGTAITELSSTVKLSDACLQQPTVLSTDTRLINAASSANSMIKANLTLTLNGEQAMVVNADNIAPFVTLDENLNATLDEASISAIAEEIASNMNTVGSTRTYTRPDGKVCTVSGGEYGWEIDEDSLVDSIVEGIKAGSTETIEVPCSQEAEVWAGAGQQDWGKRYIDVDLAEQHVYMYDSSGTLIWESDCISGIPDGEHDTSTGVYYLGPKKSPSTLIGYSNGVKIYESEVRYWMPFDGNAIGLHDADWQPDFGGTMYKDGYGSHGCVNLPVSAAKELYDLTEDGDVVVSHW